jgi:hypothetical protein
MDVETVAYFDADGKLLFIRSGGVMDPPDNAEDWATVDDSKDTNIYYDGEVKQQQPFELTKEKNKLSGIPKGTLAYMNDEVETIDDGEIDFEVNFQGTIRVYLVNPQYLAEDVSVEVGP